MTDATTLSGNSATIIQNAMSAAREGKLEMACAIGERGLSQGGDPAALHAMLGVLRCSQGELATGAHHLRSALALRPDDLTIATNLTAALAETGQHEEALAVANSERALADRSLRLLRLRAYAAQALGRHDVAISAYRLLVEANAADWEAWNNLGNSLAATGDHSGSLEALEQAFALNRDSPPTRINYARALVLAGRLEEAEGILRASIATDPRDKPALVDLAAVLKRMGEEQEVVDLLAAAAEIAPNDVDLLVNLGSEARNIRRNDLAERSFGLALGADPAFGAAYVQLATLLDHLNREGEIAPLSERAERAGAPRSTVAYIRALDHRRAGRFSEGLAELDGSGQLAGDGQRIELLRGQFLDRLGDHDAAFAAFTRMNDLLRADPSQPEERGARYRTAIREQQALVTPEWMAKWRTETKADPRPSPVFLVGFPRSGTTLLDTMLMAHPGVEVLEEEPTIREAARVLPDPAGYPTSSDEQIAAARGAYFRTAAALTPLAPGKLLVDKNPFGMNSLPLIRRLFPDARIILALRHPCDVVLSCFITNFKLNGGMANFVRLDTTAELYDLSFNYLRRVEQVMGLPVHQVRYEQLVTDREQALRALLAFMGLDWTDQVLDHEPTARARDHIKTASYAQVVEPIYTRSAGRWQNYRKHLEPVLPVLEPWIETFGYTL